MKRIMKQAKGKKRWVKKIFPGNPVSDLGWLGFLGIFGLFFVPLMAPFILCFTFFGYSRMTPDELFWESVRKSANRAFWTFFGFNTLVLVAMTIRGFTSGIYPSPEFQGDSVVISTFMFDSCMYFAYTFMINILLMILVFSISMMHIRHQEKKMMKEQEASDAGRLI